MNKSQKIDVLAHCSKLVLDLVPMEEKSREWTKVGIDLSAEVLKCVVLNDDDVQQIRHAAKHHGLDQVIAFPCVIQGQKIEFLRMYGGAISDFCRQLGIQQISENTVPVDLEYLTQMERQYGVVLYDRNVP